MNKPYGYWNNIDNCIQEAKKYTTVYELQRNCYGCYCGLKRNGWLQEAFPNSFKNKSFGYWIKENVISEARKYKTKREFKEKCKTAYNSAYVLGCMKECEEFFERNKNYRNFEDKVHSIYVYEIKEFNTCYVGRTVNVHNRDLSHRRGRKHSDRRITYDNLYKFCEKNNIDIPQPIILETNLNANESLDREDFWLKEYIKEGWIALNAAKTGLSSGSLGGVQIWNYDKCKEVCGRFHYKTDVKKFNYQCYKLCSKNKWFEEFGIIENKRHSRFYWLSKKNCFNELQYYQTKEDFKNYAVAAYASIVENGWIKEIDEYYKIN